MKNSLPPRCPDTLFAPYKYAEIRANSSLFNTMKALSDYLGMSDWAIPQAAIDAAGIEVTLA
jgi:hypothetical protein